MLGNYCTLGNNCTLGNYCTLGNNCTLSNYCTLGNDCTLGDDWSSSHHINEVINRYKQFGDNHIFIKWVTEDRKSPEEYGKLTYNVGDIVEEPTIEKSDQQCTNGIHVFRVGVHPNECGYAFGAVIPIMVKVHSNDIVFPGLPGNMDKLRVRKCEVLT